jgi:hypothetical protein
VVSIAASVAASVVASTVISAVVLSLDALLAVLSVDELLPQPESIESVSTEVIKVAKILFFILN